VALFVAAWGAMLFARSANARGGVALSRLAIGASLVLAVAASVALLVGPSTYGMNPQANVYPAIVWVLVGWTLAHVAVGVIMQVYCLARSFAGRLTYLHDMDLRNTCLYWHFLMITAAITGAVIGVFPEVSR
jgi:cytochrome c oxidase subunit I+III